MIISAKVIRRPRKPRKCDACNVPIEGPVLRLYGAAEPGDPPWPLYLHPRRPCAGHDPKVDAALASPEEAP